MDDKKSILYVDDEHINLKVFELSFKKNFLIHTAPQASKGLEILDEHPDISVVITDMKMPGMNGVEFVREAKKKHPDVYYLILTGFGMNEEIEAAMNEGYIEKYFQKPFNKPQIQATISDLTSS
jgi:response regulator RpfG family c-di-GMP phosphodiesterase